MRMRPNAKAVLLAVLSVDPIATRAATITLNASDATNASSFNAATNWSNSAAPSAVNDYVVGPGLTLRTPANQAANLAFGGNNLTLSDALAGNAILLLKNNTGTTTTVNNLALDGGQIQNGGNGANAATSVTVAGNAITLGPAAGGTFNAIASGRVLNVAAPITGAGQLTLNAAGGLVTLGGVNTYTGATTIAGTLITADGALGAVRAADGTNLPTAGNVYLNGGVLETASNVTRELGNGAGQIRLGGAAAGFSAVGADVTVALGGAADPWQLTWGSGAFAQQILVLNGVNATNALTLANAIDLGTATRTLFNSGTATSSVTLAGGLGSETATSGINFYGRGTTILNTTNAFTGAVTIGSSTGSATTSTAGVVRVTAGGALGTGVVSIGTGGNATTARLELAGNVTLPNAINLPVRTAATAGIVNLGGNNTLSNTVNVASGGTYGIIQSDSGTLTLTGAFGSNATAINSSAGGNRTVTLQGAGNGIVGGVIANASGTVLGVAKAGAGTWTLASSANSYAGPTTLIGGTLATSSLAAGGSNSGIGASTNAAANLVLAGGTLRYTGGAADTDRLFTVGAAGGTSDASGTAAAVFSNAAAHLTADPATNGTFSSGGTTVTVTAGAVAGLIVGQTVSGAGIRTGTVVSGVNYNAGTFVLNQTTTAAGTAAALTFGATPVRTLTLAGSNTADNAINGALANSGTGRVLAVVKTGPGTWALRGANTYTGTTTVSGGTLKASVAGDAANNLLTNAGGVDLGDVAGRLVLDYAAGGQSPAAAVQSILASQYAAAGNSAAGFRVGRLRSTALSGEHTIGYADNGAGFVTIRVTLPGDADVDGDVDFADFVALQANFGGVGTRFDQGDFDYDAATDFADFVALQTYFGQSFGRGVPRPNVTAEQVAAVTAFGLSNAVPEPACVSVLGLGAAALRRRRTARRFPL